MRYLNHIIFPFDFRIHVARGKLEGKSDFKKSTLIKMFQIRKRRWSWEELRENGKVNMIKMLYNLSRK